jgi:hypothetical protein
MRRKIRTESTRKRKVQSYLYKNMKKDQLTDINNDQQSITVPTNNRFYKTLNNFEINT